MQVKFFKAKKKNKAEKNINHQSGLHEEITHV